MTEPALSANAFFTGAQPTLRGSGLVLRPWRADDAPAIARAYADPELSHWILSPVSGEAQARAWIDGRNRRWAAHAGVDWAVVADDEGQRPDDVVRPGRRLGRRGDDGRRRGDGPLLGRIGIHRLVVHQGLGEVAYWVVPEARGGRIASRALGVLSEWAFTQRGVHRLEVVHSVGNPASCRVAQRAGFPLEGTMREQLRHSDGWHDMHLHARLAGDPPPDGR